MAKIVNIGDYVEWRARNLLRNTVRYRQGDVLEVRGDVARVREDGDFTAGKEPVREVPLRCVTVLFPANG